MVADGLVERQHTWKGNICERNMAEQREYTEDFRAATIFHGVEIWLLQGAPSFQPQELEEECLYIVGGGTRGWNLKWVTGFGTAKLEDVCFQGCTRRRILECK